MSKSPRKARKRSPEEEAVATLLESMTDTLREIVHLLAVGDRLGAAEELPDNSPSRRTATKRDGIDVQLSRFRIGVNSLISLRASTSWCSDLLVDESMSALGDGPKALRLMRQQYSQFGDERHADGTLPPDSFPHFFVWDTYLRVLALSELADEYPDHVRTAAALMDGWPMVVRHHLKHEDEFQRLTGLLGVGSEYPFDVSPRRKRGSGTLLFQYLEPIVFMFHRFRATYPTRKSKDEAQEFVRRVRFELDGDDRTEGEIPEAVLAAFRAALKLPPLTCVSAAAWSHKILVPYILATEIIDRSRAIPVLRNIWRHRAVKSIPTFRSRLESAVTDTLRRYGRSTREGSE